MSQGSYADPPDAAELEPLARDIYGVMKDYADSLDPEGDPNFTSYEDENDEMKGLLFALARHFRARV